jgi:hypothetical protein
LFENGLSEKISGNNQLSEEEDQIRQAQSELGFDYSDERGLRPSKEVMNAATI